MSSGPRPLVLTPWTGFVRLSVVRVIVVRTAYAVNPAQVTLWSKVRASPLQVDESASRACLDRLRLRCLY